MIRFVYDNDVIGHLIERPDYAEQVELVRESINRGINSCHFPEIGYREIVKGVTAKNLSTLQELIRQAYRLSGDGGILLHPYDHIRMSVIKIDNKEIIVPSDRLIKSMKSFTQVDGMEDFRSLFDEWQDSLRTGGDKFTQDSEVAREDLLANSGKLKRSDLKNLLDGNHPRAVFEFVLPFILKSFKLEKHLLDESPDDISTKWPSLRLVAELIRAHFHKLHFNRKKLAVNDLYDLHRAFYLDACDYLVTDDGKYRALFDDSNSDLLFGRAISLKKFLEHVKRPFLISRSTIKESRIFREKV